MITNVEPKYEVPYHIPYRTGFVAGCFDVVHPGYIAMFEETKAFCEYLIVAIQRNPSIERPEKMPPVLSMGDRVAILESIKYVDRISTYDTEVDLLELLKNSKPDVRFLGDDYKDGKKTITGIELNIPIHWIVRSEWSATRFKEMIRNSFPKEYKHDGSIA